MTWQIESRPARDRTALKVLAEPQPSFKSTTQRGLILAYLLRGWTCGTELLDLHAPRYSAVIHVLKDDHEIERRLCQNPRHSHKSRQYEWRVTPYLEPRLPGIGRA